MASLVQALARKGLAPPISLMSGLKVFPASVRDLVRLLEFPPPNLSIMEEDKLLKNWGEGDSTPQGLAWAHDCTWFFSRKVSVWKAALNDGYSTWGSLFRRLGYTELNEMFGGTDIRFDEQAYNHIGDIDYGDGLLFAPVEHYDYSNKRKYPLLLVLSEDLELVGYSFLEGRAQGDGQVDYSAGSCTLSPNKRVLYTSADDRPHKVLFGIHDREGHTHLHAYDVTRCYERLATPSDWGTPLDVTYMPGKALPLTDGSGNLVVVEGYVQGAVFTPDYRIMLATSYPNNYVNGTAVACHNQIWTFDGLTGKLFGARSYDFDGYDELEGITVHPAEGVFVMVGTGKGWKKGDLYRYPFPD